MDNANASQQLASELLHLSRYGGPNRPGALNAAPTLRRLMSQAGISEDAPALLGLLDRGLTSVSRSDLQEVGRAAFRRTPYDDDLLEDRLDRCAHLLVRRLTEARQDRGQTVPPGGAPVPSLKTMNRRRAELARELAQILCRTLAQLRRPEVGNGDDIGQGGSTSPERRPIPGDCSEFVGDVTIPDGSLARHQQRFVKQWELRNAGTVPWINRYLTRQGASDGHSVPKTLSRVPIPDTQPGESVLIAVTVEAPRAAGTYEVHWKMTDQAGRTYFPDRYWPGIWFSVVVPGPH